jgi:hypothetical protein
MTATKTDTTYNGWTNYETWLVKLWMDNDQGSYEYWREAARDAWQHPVKNQFIDSRKDRARIALAERLKDDHEEAVSDLKGFAADLMNAALSSVDWDEIASALLDDDITDTCVACGGGGCQEESDHCFTCGQDAGLWA